ncbi:unnamed protein product [Schistocephalus solidus]|uniref:BAH domain-containing protein n=1 Tax=Schistocephalus solidus TaxID=70667 RepID=A0A183T6N0_SCHSO|nr:unnamed protein product [Schistocephalus solidus]
MRDQQDVLVTKAIPDAEGWTDNRFVISKMRLRLQPRRRSQGKRPPGKSSIRPFEEVCLSEKLERVRHLVSSQLAQLRKQQRSRRRLLDRTPSPTGLSWLRDVALHVGVPEEEVSELIKPSAIKTAAITASSPRRGRRRPHQLIHSVALESVLNDLSTTFSDISDDDVNGDIGNGNRMLPPPAPLRNTPLSHAADPARSQCSRLSPNSKPRSLSDDSDEGALRELTDQGEEEEEADKKKASLSRTQRRKRRLHDHSPSATTEKSARSVTVSPDRDGGARKRRCRRPTASADKSRAERVDENRTRGSLPPPPPPRRRRQRLDSTASAVSCLSAVTSVMLENLSLARLQKADDSDLSFVVDDTPATTDFARARSQRRVSCPRRGSKQPEESVKKIHPPVHPGWTPRNGVLQHTGAHYISTSPPVLRPSTSPEPDRLHSPHPVSAKLAGPVRLPAIAACPSTRLRASRKGSTIDLDLDADMPAGRVITHPKMCRRRDPSATPSTILPPTTPNPSPSAVISQILNAHYPAGVADWFNLLTSDDPTSMLRSSEGPAKEEAETIGVQEAASAATTTPARQRRIDQDTPQAVVCPIAEQKEVGNEDHVVSVAPTSASLPESPPLLRPQVIDSKSLSTADNQRPTPPHSTSRTSVHLSLGAVSSPHPPSIGSIPKGSFTAPLTAETPEEDQELSVEETVLHYLFSTVASASKEEALAARLRQLEPTATGASTVLSALLRLRTGTAREICLPDVTTVPEPERRAARLLIAFPLPALTSAVLQPSFFLSWLTKQRSSLSLCQFFRLAQTAFLACPPHAITGLVYSTALLVNGATGWVLKPPLPVTCLLVASDSAVPGLWRQRLRCDDDDEGGGYCYPLAVTADVRFGGSDGPTASALQLSSLQHLVAVEVAACGSQSGALSRSLIRRLVATGWLPRDSDAAVATADAPARLVLAVEVQRTRDFLLFLVDECLGIQRHRGQALKAETPLRLPNAEAGLALRLVLSLVAFSDLAQGDSDGKQKPTSSRQRMLKNREAKSIRFGTLGWLLSGRLLPWLTSLTTSKKSCPVVERRLAVLCTDVLLLGVQLDLARTTARGGGNGNRGNPSLGNFQRGLALCAERLCSLLLCPRDAAFHPEQLFSLLRLLPTRPSAICEALEHREVTAIDAAWLSQWEPESPPSFTSYPTQRAVDLLSPLLTQSNSCLDLPTDSHLSRLLDSCRLALQTHIAPQDHRVLSTS